MFSGRRDPAWTVNQAKAAKLMRLWARLEPFPGPKPVLPALGYRGCSLESPEGQRWEAFSGVVWSGNDARADPEGTFEKALLKTAPVKSQSSIKPLLDSRGSVSNHPRRDGIES